MAEKEKEDVETSVFNFIKEYWLWIAAIILGFFVWKYGLEIGALSLAGTIFLGWIAWKLWIHYIQQDFISGIDFVLLEIVPPREVLRSPKAMELFMINALYHFSIKGGKEAYWQGAVWFWFSLEIASIDGQVHFYIRTPTRIKGLIETQIYAQYPQAQIKEVEDYTLAVDEISPESSWNAWGCEFALQNPEAFPINTYVDYGLDKDPKEELKIDPISSVIELFGSLKKGEQMWMQIVIRPSKQEYHTHGTYFGKHDWVEEANMQIEKLRKPFVDAGSPPSPSVSKYIEVINNKISKIGFDTGIRVCYVAKKENFDMNNRRNIRLIFRQYANPNKNQLNRINSSQADFYSAIFTAPPKTVMMLANRLVHEFRERAFFYLPLRHHIFSQSMWRWPFPGVFSVDSFIKAYAHHHTFVLNVEELATLWHFPGQILKVPTLERIESKEASPPTNLPT